MTKALSLYDLEHYDYTLDRTTFAPIPQDKKGQNETTVNTLLASRETLVRQESIPLRELAKIDQLCKELLREMGEQKKSTSFWNWVTPKIKGEQEITALSQSLSKKVQIATQADRKRIESLHQSLQKQLGSLELEHLGDALVKTSAEVLGDITSQKAKNFCLEQATHLLDTTHPNLKARLEMLVRLGPDLSWLKKLFSSQTKESVLRTVVSTLYEVLITDISLPEEARLNSHILQRAEEWLDPIETPQMPLYEKLLAAFEFVELPKRLHKNVVIGDLLTSFSNGKEKERLSLLFSYLKELAQFGREGQLEEALHKGVSLLCQHDINASWISKLKQVTERPATRFFAAIDTELGQLEGKAPQNLSHQIFLRYKQITNAPVKKQHKLLPLDALCLARFIETDMQQTTYYENKYFDKDEYNLPRSIHYQVTKREISILLKRKPKGMSPFFYFKGGFKKVCGAIHLSYNIKETPATKAQSVNAYPRKKKNPEDQSEIIPTGDYDIDPTKFNYEEVKNKLIEEAKLHKEMTAKKMRGIWPLDSYAIYEKELVISSSERKTLKVPMLSCISELADGNIFAMLCDPNTIKKTSPYILFRVFEELTYGVYNLHSNGYIHCDLKVKNAVMRLNGNEVEAGLIDFGFTYKVGVGKPVKILSQGFYGSVESTPPELLCKADYPQSEHYMIEMFAFGYLLYTLLKGKNPVWGEKILDLYWHKKPEEVNVDSVVGEIRRDIHEHVEKASRTLFHKRKRTLLEDLELYALDMMQSEPRARLDAKKALARIQEIRTKHVT